MTEMTSLSKGRFVVPDVVSSHFALRAGDIVADFGAGQGFFVKVLSRLVGDEGTVYSCEIQKNLVEAVGDMLRTESINNVSVLWCDLEEINGTKIPSAELDAGMMINTLFQIEDKDTALEEIKRTLRKGGKFFIIDWTESFNGLGPQPEQVVTEAEARALAEQHGFTFEHTFDAGDHHYGLAFRL